jgi:hypothetical protein
MSHVVHMNKRTEIQKVVDMGTRKFVTSTIVHLSKIVEQIILAKRVPHRE